MQSVKQGKVTFVAKGRDGNISQYKVELMQKINLNNVLIPR